MKKNLLKISIIAVLLVIMLSTVVHGYQFNTTMTTDSTTIGEATEFTVKVGISNIDAGTNGIHSLTGYLSYDKDVFEPINDTSIVAFNRWSFIFDDTTGKVTLTTTSPVKEDEDVVFSITFKTKAGTSGKEGNIYFRSIVGSNSEQPINSTDVSTRITVGTASEPVANTTNSTSNLAINISYNPVNNVVNNTTVNNVVNNVVNNTTNNVVPSYVNNSSSSDSDIPYTGVEDTVMYVMIAFVVIAVVFYIKFEMINKEIKK